MPLNFAKGPLPELINGVCGICGEGIAMDQHGLGEKMICPHCECETTIQSFPANTFKAAPPPEFKIAQAFRVPCEDIAPRRITILWIIPLFVCCALVFAWSSSFADNTDNHETIAGMGFVLGGVLSIIIYIVPSIVARQNNKRNIAAICALNIFLGWTLIGWVIALVWALMKENAPDRSVNHIQQSRHR